MTDFNALLRLLTENHVEFIMVGGAAATALIVMEQFKIWTEDVRITKLAICPTYILCVI